VTIRWAGGQPYPFDSGCGECLADSGFLFAL